MFSKVIKQTQKIASLVENQSQSFASFTKEPKRVAVTGAAGQIGYATLFRIASGQMLGADQPVILHLIDIPQAQDVLKGVEMELNDCAFPTLAGVVCTDSLTTGFTAVDYCLLVGAKPRGPGMERGDLLKDNGKIFIDQGKAINDNASRDVKVVVVGNPANTNCMIANHYAPDLPNSAFTAMTRLDHNRALFQIADKCGTTVNDVQKFCIWGNHSPTMYPDLHSCTLNKKAALFQVTQHWVDNDFLPTVQQRGAAIIKARKLSSAASAGSSAIDHIHDWELGTNGKWTSMAVVSNGEYDVPQGLVFSYPVTCNEGKWEIVKGLIPNYEQQRRIDITTEELLQEREAVSMYLK